ncbi:hypothetical protein BaRGS_00026917 [Batillaria attramentaria]|uniref:Uncharacterized protein n=1 Tax=Batillaria attramentaria TaxID=370345 RepID=A0ABD0K4Y9_9CAEN
MPQLRKPAATDRIIFLPPPSATDNGCTWAKLHSTHNTAHRRRRHYDYKHYHQALLPPPSSVAVVVDPRSCHNFLDRNKRQRRNGCLAWPPISASTEVQWRSNRLGRIIDNSCRLCLLYRGSGVWFSWLLHQT